MFCNAQRTALTSCWHEDVEWFEIVAVQLVLLHCFLNLVPDLQRPCTNTREATDEHGGHNAHTAVHRVWLLA